MSLLGLPLEVFREIIEQVYSCGDVHDLGSLNSSISFSFEKPLTGCAPRSSSMVKMNAASPSPRITSKNGPFAPDVSEDTFSFALFATSPIESWIT